MCQGSDSTPLMVVPPWVVLVTKGWKLLGKIGSGAEASEAVMVGDTSFDMDMAKSGGMRAIGVSWGYHDRSALTAADAIIDDFRALPGAITQLWEPA